MNFAPLMVGVAATILALVQLLAWAALGSFFVDERQDSEAVVPLSLLIGSGLTGAVLALLTAAGLVDVAIAVWALGCLTALVLRRDYVRRMVRYVGDCYSTATTAHPWLRIVLMPAAVLFWVAAIAPPRDADVMRYHLAHVRQILVDGVWTPLPDYQYAMPFGWTLNYLGFEHLGLPETAHLLSLGLWVVALGIILAWLHRHGGTAAAMLLAVAVTLQPFVLKAVTTAHVDAYSMFTVFAVALLLARTPSLTARELFLLGFAAWIGAQSRYQLVAVGLVTSAMVLVGLMRRASARDISSFAAGAVFALALSAPFYVANLVSLGNPVWPLLIKLFNTPASYADQVTALYQASMTGSYSLRYVADTFVSLMTNPLVAPIPMLTAACAILWWRHPLPAVRVLGAFTGVFFLVWVAAEPALYFRFILFFVAPVIMVGGLLIVRAGRRRILDRFAVVGLGALSLAFLAADAFYTLDAARYVVTGDRDRYHAFTWYYPVYEWANRTTPRDSRFLVIVFSGHSYYLDRPYRRADPWLSGVVDWTSVKTGDDVLREIERGGYDYVIYHERDWSPMIGGRAMTAAIADAVKRELVDPMARFQLCLATGRVRRSFISSRVVVLRPRLGKEAVPTVDYDAWGHPLEHGVDHPSDARQLSPTACGATARAE
jgi:hypothetical protein